MGCSPSRWKPGATTVIAICGAGGPEPGASSARNLERQEAIARRGAPMGALADERRESPMAHAHELDETEGPVFRKVTEDHSSPGGPRRSTPTTRLSKAT